MVHLQPRSEAGKLIKAERRMVGMNS